MTRLCATCTSLFTTIPHSPGANDAARSIIKEPHGFKCGADSETVSDYLFNRNAASLAAAADPGCYICRILWKHVARYIGWDFSQAHKDVSENLKCLFQIQTIDEESFRVVVDLDMHPWSQRVDFVGFSDKRMRDSGLVSRFSKSTRLDASFDQARQWLKHCQKSHKSCRSKRPSYTALPTRLIHVERCEGIITANLCTGEHLPRDTQYLTLSHCWGSIKFLTLKKGNRRRFYQEIPVSRLSKSFQDALLVTAELGFEYIWIDSLCIIQDCLEDWKHESWRMADIYKNATCNLTAAAFKDGLDGFLPNKRYSDPTPAVVTNPWSGMTDTLEEYKNKPFSIIDGMPWLELWSGPLFQRAWVLQELLLAPRALHFGGDQIYWECKHSLASEMWPSGWIGSPLEAAFKENLSDYPLGQYSMSRVFSTSESPYDTWKRIVESFTARDITYPSDRLPALEGIAADFSSRLASIDMTISHDNIRGSYYYGIWLDDLPRELLWKLKMADPNPPDNSNASLAPSWSWASLNQDICWYQSCFQQTPTKFPPSEIEREISKSLLTAFSLVPLQIGKYSLSLTGKLMHFDTADWEDCTLIKEHPERTPLLHYMLRTDQQMLEFSLDQSYVEELTPRDSVTQLHHNYPSRATMYLSKIFFMPLIRSREELEKGRICNGVLGLVVAPVLEGVDEEPQIGVYRRVGTGHVYLTGGNDMRAEEDWGFEECRERCQRGIERWRYDDKDGEGNYSIFVV